MNFKNGELITSVDVIDNTLEYQSAFIGFFEKYEATIEIISTTTGIRFSSGEAIDANGHKFQSGDKLIISFLPATDLHFQADNIGDTFVITV